MEDIIKIIILVLLSIYGIILNYRKGCFSDLEEKERKSYDRVTNFHAKIFFILFISFFIITCIINKYFI
jgi:hypothetical protein